MPEMKRMQESRVLEICTHGLTRGAEEISAPTLPVKHFLGSLAPFVVQIIFRVFRGQ